MSNQFYAPVDAIKRTTKPMRGGLWSIFYVPVEQVTSVPAINMATRKISNNIVVATWYKLSTPSYKKAYREEAEKAMAAITWISL